MQPPWVARKPEIIRRLTKKLGIEPGLIARDLHLPAAIALSSNLDELLREPAIDTHSNDISGAAGTHFPYFPVPAKKRWRLIAYNREASIGDSRVEISDGTLRFGLEAIAAATNVDILPQFLTLDQDWTVGLRTTGNVADTAINLDIYYEEEDAF